MTCRIYVRGVQCSQSFSIHQGKNPWTHSYLCSMPFVFTGTPLLNDVLVWTLDNYVHHMDVSVRYGLEGCVHMWQYPKESEEQCVLNDSNWLSWLLNSMSLKCSYDFKMKNLSLEWQREHWKLFYKIVSIKPCINREINSRISQLSYKVIVVTQTWSF